MRPIVTDRVAWSVGLSVGLWVCHSSEPCKNGWTNPDDLWVVGLDRTKESWIRWGSRSPILEVPDPTWRGNFKSTRGCPLQSIVTLCRELFKDGWTDRDAVWDLHLGGPKQACIRGCSLGPPAKYHWTTYVQRQCGMLSNYFDTLLVHGTAHLSILYST